MVYKEGLLRSIEHVRDQLVLMLLDDEVADVDAVVVRDDAISGNVVPDGTAQDTEAIPVVFSRVPREGVVR